MSVLIQPILTEKSLKKSEAGSEYIFRVKKDSEKKMIKKEIETKYGVSVESVRTLISLGKSKSRATKKGMQTGKQSDYKKAFVKLAKDQKIDFHSRVENPNKENA